MNQILHNLLQSLLHMSIAVMEYMHELMTTIFEEDEEDLIYYTKFPPNSI